MPSNTRTFDDKTKIINYLNAHYLGRTRGHELLRRKRIIREATTNIFSLHYFPSDQLSIIWYRQKIHQILGDMRSEIYKRSVKPLRASTV